jgi:hypothetical protein
MVVISAKASGAEVAFVSLLSSFKRDFVPAWTGKETTNWLLNKASKIGCSILLNTTAKGTLFGGITLRELPFQKALDHLGGIDASFLVNGKLIGFDITLDIDSLTEKERKLTKAWEGQRQKLLQALGYEHVVLVVWKPRKSMVNMTSLEKGELVEKLLVHLEKQEERRMKKFCSKFLMRI